MLQAQAWKGGVEHQFDPFCGVIEFLVESVKAASDVFAPVSGEVVEVNKGAIGEPGIINDDPFGDGWLIKLKVSTDVEIGKLMSADAYAEYVAEEEQEK